MNLFEKESSLEASRHTISFVENLLRASSDGIVITDTSHNIIVINEAFCELFSQNRNDMLETNLLIWLDQFESNSLKKWNELEKQLRNKKVCRNVEFCTTKNGKTRYLNVNASILDQAENEETGSIISIWHDITEHKRAVKNLLKSEKTLKNNQSFLNRIINQSPYATWVSDEKGTIIKCNAALEKLLNITGEQLIGKYNVFEDEIAIEQGLIPKIRTVFEDGKTANFAVEWDAKELGYKDAIKVHIEGTMFPIHDDKGNLTNVVNHWIDISKRKQAEKAKKQLEAKLQQSQKMESVGTLAGGIAHDFNNILFPIVGHTEMLIEDNPENSPLRDSLDEIYTAALRAKELVKQILTFSRKESGELKLMKIQPIIKEALKLIRSTIPTTIEIKQTIQSDCGVIEADPTQIHQIVMNFSTNAYHAMEATGGILKVSLKEIELTASDLISPDMTPGIYACLTISDTGIGMDRGLIEKIFDPFFSTKEVDKGTGLGLSVAHGIILNMNGSIHVNSTPGEGTKFDIYLPVYKNLSEKQERQAEKSILGGTERILLVDDEESIITMEKRLLKRLGYQVTSHTSSVEAVEVFRTDSNKFDIVITDMQMPNMSGDKLASELTKIRPDIPILLCTGFSEIMSEEKAASIGIKGFLVKPITMKALSYKIREVLDKRLKGDNFS